MNHARMMMMMLLIGTVLLAACAPAVQVAERPMLLVVAGPTERPLADVDEAMRVALRRAGFEGSFGPTAVRAIAERRDLSERQALQTTAELGRIAGADVALYVNVSRLERDVEGDRRALRRQVLVRLQLRATLVDPATGALLWSTRDVERTAVRTESAIDPLPSLLRDPGALQLRDASVGALARDVMARLAEPLP